MPTAGQREKVDRDGQTRDAGNNEGQGRTQGVDNMGGVDISNILRGVEGDLTGGGQIMILDGA